MLFGEAISIALQSLRANKLRSLLTVLGILIGVSSVIAVVASTEGLDRYMSEKVLELGTKAFRLQSRPDIINSHEMWLEMMKRKRLNMDDYEAVQKAWTLCSEVGAQVWTGTNVKRGRVIQKNVGVAGITEMDAIVRSPLPSIGSEALPNSRAPSLREHYLASPLLRAPPPPSRLPPTSQEPWL